MSAPIKVGPNTPGDESVTGASRRWRPFQTLSLTAGVILAALVAYPLATVFMRLFYKNGLLDLSGLLSLFTEPGVGTLVANTLVVVMLSSVLALVFGSVMAWLNERTDARVGIITDVLPIVPFVLPPVAGAVGWLLLLSPRSGYINFWLRDILSTIGIEVGREGPINILSLYGLIFVYAVYMVPYVFVMMSAALRSFDASLEEQSRVCGAGLLVTIFSVTLPALRPSIAGAALLLAWFGFGIYSIPAILGTQSGVEVLAVRIVNLISFSYPARIDAAVGLSLLVVFLVGATMLIMRRVIRSGNFVRIGGKGQHHARIRLARWRLPARALLFGYVLIAAVLPLCALVVVSLTGYWNPEIDLRDFSLLSFRESILGKLGAREAFLHSVALGFVGATVAIILVVLLAEYGHRSRSRVVPVLDGIIKLPATLSNIVLALGFVLAFSGPPFFLHGTLLILLLAYIAVHMPQASVAADTAVSQVGDELVEASQLSGAGVGSTFFRISFPLMLPSLVAGWAFMFVRIAGDLNASAILAGTNNRVVGSYILEVYSSGSFSDLASVALALTLIAIVIVTIAMTVPRLLSRRWSSA